jgi:hypothetical protein
MNPLLVAILLTVVVLSATDNRSFWIDESAMAEFAKKPTIAECWRAMLRVPEVQQPLYMLYMWSYTHLFGSGEWALRIAGLPWFVVGACVFVWALGRSLGSTMAPVLVIATNAFLWYYANEARVYLLQLGLALGVVGCAIECIRSAHCGATGIRPFQFFLASLVLFCGTSILAAAWGAFFLVAFLVCIPTVTWLQWFRAARWTTAVCAVGLAVLAAYYTWTMTLHARASTVGTTTMQTMVFVFYELLGAAGLGPGRNDLRGTGASALKPFAAPVLAYAGVVGWVMWYGAKEIVRRFELKRVLLVAALVLIPFLLLCAIGITTRFRVLGRHATPLLPFVWVVLIFGISRIVQAKARTSLIVAGLFCCLSLVSALSIRFAARHEKDDYRDAAAFARRAALAGGTVWWNADNLGADYYHLSQDDPNLGRRVNLVINTSAEDLKNLPEPGTVVISKPDTYDLDGAVAEYIAAGHYDVAARFAGFIIWKKRPN